MQLKHMQFKFSNDHVRDIHKSNYSVCKNGAIKIKLDLGSAWLEKIEFRMDENLPWQKGTINCMRNGDVYIYDY